MYSKNDSAKVRYRPEAVCIDAKIWRRILAHVFELSTCMDMNITIAPAHTHARVHVETPAHTRGRAHHDFNDHATSDNTNNKG